MSKKKMFTPEDLAAELQSGRWRKAMGRMGRWSNQRCCLGVACEMAGIDASQRQGGRGFDGLPSRLPSPFSEQFVEAFPWLAPLLQTELAEINDGTPGWDVVIRRLEGIQGQLKERT